MKQLTCEMCGSNNLVKQDGVFVCQFCGTKYSIEEARKMMVEGTVKLDHSEQIKNLLNLAQSAYKGVNMPSALEYANKALELSHENPEAWLIKMKALGYIGTLGDLNMLEVVQAGKSAIEFSGSEKESIELDVYTYQLDRAKDLLEMARSCLLDTSDVRQTYQSFCVINFLTASQNTLNVDSKIVNLYDKVANEAVFLALAVSEDALGRYPSLISKLSDCKQLLQKETDAVRHRFSIYGATLTDSAIEVRNAKEEVFENKIKRSRHLAEEHKKKIAEEQAQKNQLYWAEHEEEKSQLESQKAILLEERTPLEIEKNRLQRQIDELQEENGFNVPALTERDKIRQHINTLQKQKKSLGLFKGKEKKHIDEQIAEETNTLNLINEKVEEQKKQCRLEASRKIAELKPNLDTLEKQISEVDQKINRIFEELNKDR